MVGARLSEFAQEEVGTAEEDRVGSARGGRTERLGEEGLADADGTDDEDVLLAFEKLEREELVEMAPVDLDGRVPVEVVEGDALLEAGLGETAFEGEVVVLPGRTGPRRRG